MTTLTRSTSRTTPAYRDYVNFLGAYKNGRREEEAAAADPSPAVDVPDFPREGCVPYGQFLESSRGKKYAPVRPETAGGRKTERAELYIEIQPPRPVNEMSKLFEGRKASPPPPKGGRVSSAVGAFERQNSKPTLPIKPAALGSRSPPPKAEMKAPSPPPQGAVGVPPPPPPPPPLLAATEAGPKRAVARSASHSAVPKMQATLKRGPQHVKHTVDNPGGVSVNGIDRNDPVVKKLVYGTLRELYGAYHDKANDMMATLPRDKVKKSNGVQDIIEKIASNGDLEKLNGRINPKLEQE